MFKERSYQKELMDDFDLSSKELGQNLRELELVNTYLGGYKVTIEALNKLIPAIDKSKELKIVDIGSGAGDMLIQMAKWSRKKNVNSNLIGIDINDYMLNYSKEKCKKYPEIQFRKANILNIEDNELGADIITLNLFCHHFTDDELKKIFLSLSNSCKVLIINDLHRHPLAYYSIKFLSLVFNTSHLFRNDAPLSVLRAFNKNELLNLLKDSHFGSYQLNWVWAFRWRLCAFRTKLEGKRQQYIN
jgi:2-polyprenyl-3-methyl-5-hydroxy-6-metoxy-1,4-benzoquinol methylase